MRNIENFSNLQELAIQARKINFDRVSFEHFTQLQSVTIVISEKHTNFMEGFEYAFPGKSQIDFTLTNDLGEYDLDNILATFGKFNAKMIKISVRKVKVTEIKNRSEAVSIWRESTENDKEIKVRGQAFRFVRNLHDVRNSYYGLEFNFQNKAHKEHINKISVFGKMMEHVVKYEN